MNMRLLKPLFFLMALMLVQLSSTAQVFNFASDEVTMNHTKLTNLQNSGIKFKLRKSDKFTTTTCDKRLESAFLTARFDMGEDFIFGGNGFFVSLTLEIEAFDASNNLLYVLPMNMLSLNGQRPEQWYRHDFTADHANVERFKIKVLNYNANVPNAWFLDSIQLHFNIEEDYRFRPNTATVTTLNSVSPAAEPVIYDWSCDCPVPSYEFQLLRLYNTDAALISDETIISANIDWSEALSLEVPDTTMRLRPSEGTGYYLWRVRPIGDYDEGGMGNVRNWGDWDGAASSETGAASAENRPHLFFYTDPSDNNNYNYQRTFTESGEMAEVISHATASGFPRQVQAFRTSDSTRVISEQLRDLSGNPVLNSMAVPSSETSLTFQGAFLQDAETTVFNANDFDADSTYLAPREVVAGTGGTYYSDANNDLSVPDAEGFGYNRTRYTNDGTGRPVEIGSPGTTHTIGSGHSTRLYYSAVSDQELTCVFGEEAPLANTVRKTIMLDANGQGVVTYTSSQGKTIITCLAASENTGLEALSSSTAATAIEDKITESHAVGSYEVHGGKRLVVTDPTTINIHYSLWPDELQSECYNFCATCDYRVVLHVHNLETPSLSESDTITIAAAACGGGTQVYSLDASYLLNPGTYTIEKQVIGNTLDPGTMLGSSVLGRTYRAEQLDSFSYMLDTALAYIYDSIIPRLDTQQIDETYALLDAWPAATFDATTQRYTVTKDCWTLDIPKLYCDSFECPSNEPDFATYFTDEINTQLGSMISSGTLDLADALLAVKAKLNFSSTNGLELGLAVNTNNTDVYTETELNTLIKNMLTDGNRDYTCSQLWTCWEGVCASAATDFLVAFANGQAYEPVRKLLECSGFQFEGVNNSLYKSHAYKYFYYNNTHSDCEATYGYMGPTTWSMDSPPVPMPDTLAWGFDPYVGRPWQKFYDCVQNQSDERPQRTAEQTADDITDACLENCEGRRASFKASVTELYDADGIAYTDADIDCVVDMMVNNCADYCDVTVYYAGGSTLRTWGGHQPPMTLVEGKTYKIFPSDPNYSVFVNYDGKIYGKNRTEGDEFVAGTETIYTSGVRNNSGGPVIGLGYQLLEQTSKVDSVGSRPQADSIRKIMTYGFDLDVPIGATCSSGSTILNEPQPRPGTNFIANASLHALSGSVCDMSPLWPAYFGNDCNEDWQESHGPSIPSKASPGASALTVPDVDPARSDRVARTESFIGTINDDAAVLGNGIMTLGSDSYVAGQEYTLTFDLRSVDGFDEADNIYVLLDTAGSGGPCASVFPYAGHRAPQPNACQQIIWHGIDYFVTEWNTITVTFKAERTGDFELVLYPRQELYEEAEPSWWADYFSSTELGSTDTTSEAITDSWLFSDPFSGRGAISVNHLTKVEFDNIEVANTIYETCNEICFNWREPDLPEPTITTGIESCLEENCHWLSTYILMQVDSIEDTIRQNWDFQYANTCINPDSIVDSFAISYELGYYHYTLFYYDLMGRLIKTVPPKGVDKDDAYTRADDPAHTLFTEYQYNSQNSLVRKETPDGGEGSYYYDRLGRIRFGQDATQHALGEYSYNRYDDLGRIVESGTSSEGISNLAEDDYLSDNTFPTTGSERTFIVFGDSPANPVYYGGKQRYPQKVQNHQVSYTYTDDGTYTYYSYDSHGSLAWMAQSVPGLTDGSTSTDALLYIGYDYDVVTGKVYQVKYNEYRPQRFFTRYSYDSDQRPVLVETSRDGLIWDRDVSLTYAAHGPLERVELGEDHVQGLDYTYTLLGWLKAINHPDLDQDPMNDGDVTLGSQFAADQFGMALGYYAGDFERTGSSFNSSTATYLAAEADLYNGNITSWTSEVAHQTGLNEYEQLTGQTFRYDELNRLTKNRFKYYEGSVWNSPTNGAYNSDYAYDANGNLTALSRVGKLGTFDDLNYSYNAGTNQLDHVDDLAGSTAMTTDLEDQAAANYRYNANGQLTKDVTEAIDTIYWNPQNKVRTIDKGSQQISFLYNANGHRVRKIADDGSQADTTFYIRDPDGHTIARYIRSNNVVRLAEQPIGISKRWGTHTPAVPVTLADTLVDTNTIVTARILDLKRYELTDHLGNVRALVSDDRQALLDYTTRTDTQQAISKGYWHYFPFGMHMPERVFAGSGHTYGFNGMERDNEVKGNGNEYTTTFRQFDPRVGRWLSTDPLEAQFAGESPYNGMGDNPVLFNDPTGEAPIPTTIVDANGNTIPGSYNEVRSRFYQAGWKRVAQMPGQVVFSAPDGSSYVRLEATGGVAYGSQTPRIVHTRQVQLLKLPGESIASLRKREAAAGIVTTYVDHNNTTLKRGQAGRGHFRMGKITVGSALFLFVVSVDGAIAIYNANSLEEAAFIAGGLAAAELAGAAMLRYAPRAAGPLSFIFLPSDNPRVTAEIQQKQWAERMALEFMEKHTPNEVGYGLFRAYPKNEELFNQIVNGFLNPIPEEELIDMYNQDQHETEEQELE